MTDLLQEIRTDNAVLLKVLKAQDCVLYTHDKYLIFKHPTHPTHLDIPEIHLGFIRLAIRNEQFVLESRNQKGSFLKYLETALEDLVQTIKTSYVRV